MYRLVKQFLGGSVMMALLLAPAVHCRAQEMPDTVTLDSLNHLYEAVEFDHESHLDLADDCADCHHHTTGTQVTAQPCFKCHSNSPETAVVACSKCHPREPFSAEYIKEKQQNNGLYHTDQLGLKAAYHVNCVGCHEKMDGPTGCEDCHGKTQAGEAFYHSGDYAPKQGKHSASGH